MVSLVVPAPGVARSEPEGAAVPPSDAPGAADPVESPVEQPFAASSPTATCMRCTSLFTSVPSLRVAV